MRADAPRIADAARTADERGGPHFTRGTMGIKGTGNNVWRNEEATGGGQIKKDEGKMGDEPQKREFGRGT